MEGDYQTNCKYEQLFMPQKEIGQHINPEEKINNFGHLLEGKIFSDFY